MLPGQTARAPRFTPCPAVPGQSLRVCRSCACARSRVRAFVRACRAAASRPCGPPPGVNSHLAAEARSSRAGHRAGRTGPRPPARTHPTAGRTRRKGAAPCVSPAAGLRGARKRRVPAGGSRRHPSVTEHAPAGPRQAGAPAPAPAEVRRAETPVRALSRDPQAPAASTRRRRRHGAPGRRCSCARFDWPAERDPVNGRRTYHRPARWLPAPAGCGA